MKNADPLVDSDEEFADEHTRTDYSAFTLPWHDDLRILNFLSSSPAPRCACDSAEDLALPAILSPGIGQAPGQQCAAMTQVVFHSLEASFVNFGRIWLHTIAT